MIDWLQLATIVDGMPTVRTVVFRGFTQHNNGRIDNDIKRFKDLNDENNIEAKYMLTMCTDRGSAKVKQRQLRQPAEICWLFESSTPNVVQFRLTGTLYSIPCDKHFAEFHNDDDRDSPSPQIFNNDSDWRNGIRESMWSRLSQQTRESFLSENELKSDDIKCHSNMIVLLFEPHRVEMLELHNQAMPETIHFTDV